MFGKKSDVTVKRIVKHAFASILLLKLSQELRKWAKK